MAIDEPKDMLIECQDCKIENIFTDYTPSTFILCNQCREQLVHPNFNETHNEYRCDDCGFTICLLKETEFAEGETPCRCESLNMHLVNPSTLYENALNAGAFEEDDIATKDFDWFRSEDAGTGEDYNEIFDQDPGNN